LQALLYLKGCTAGTARQEAEAKYLCSALKDVCTAHHGLVQTDRARAALVSLLQSSKGLPDLACTLLPAALANLPVWPLALFHAFLADVLRRHAWATSRSGTALAHALQAALLRSAPGPGVAPAGSAAPPTAQHDSAAPSPSVALDGQGPVFENGQALAQEFLYRFCEFVWSGQEGSLPLDKLASLLAFACRHALLLGARLGSTFA
jgi:hypothetical protein